jgi:hypothetical protein
MNVDYNKLTDLIPMAVMTVFYYKYILMIQTHRFNNTNPTPNFLANLSDGV